VCVYNPYTAREKYQLGTSFLILLVAHAKLRLRAQPEDGGKLSGLFWHTRAALKMRLTAPLLNAAASSQR
jgi:hypothetical protein